MNYLSLAAAARRIPPHGVAPSTVFRWIRDGITVGSRRIRLRGKYVGRRLITSDEWLKEFSVTLTQAKLESPKTSAHTVDSHSDDDLENALRKKGLAD